MGLPEEVTDWCSCSISEKAALRPYHCGLVLFASFGFRERGRRMWRPSVQSWSFFRVGLPANNCFALVLLFILL